MTDFRDLDKERLVTGHVLTWPEDLVAYRRAGLIPQDFTDGDLRLVWNQILDLEARGVAPDERTVRDLVIPRGVPPPFLSALVDGIPRQAPANIQHHVEHLATFRRCREYERQEKAALAQLSAFPALINNGLLGHRVEELTALQNAGLDVDLLIDDVALLDLPPPKFLIEERLVADTNAAIAGPPGCGKTFVAIDLAMSTATGLPWLGARVASSGPTVYCAAEGVAGLQARVRAWKIAFNVPLEQPSGFRLYPRALNLLDAAAVETFLRVTRRLRPVLVVFDTLARCMAGGDENSALDMGRVIAAADHIRVTLGATVLFLHHTTKAGGAERGSSALRGALDTLLTLTPTDDVLTLSCEKQKDAPAFSPFDLRLDQVAGSCVARLVHQTAVSTSPGTGLSEWQVRCLKALRTNFPQDIGASSTEWMETVPEVNRRTFYHARTVLHERGYLAFRGQKNVWTGKTEP